MATQTQPNNLPLPCCLQGIEWNGTPTGTEITVLLPTNPNPNPNPDTNTNPNPSTQQPSPPKKPIQTYKTGTNPRVAILLIHDLLGWRFPNTRLLADAYARDVGATAYVPDFFGGESLPTEPILAGRWGEIGELLAGFMARNSRGVREGEILGFARALKARKGEEGEGGFMLGGYERVGAVGFCYGGWAVFRLAAAAATLTVFGDGGGSGNGGEKRKKLVDCISAGHPSLLTKEDIEGVDGVPTQILAPERDVAFTDELKMHSWLALQRNGVPFSYVHFPGVEHGCLVRGDEKEKGEREAMARAVREVVAWARLWLCDD